MIRLIFFTICFLFLAPELILSQSMKELENQYDALSRNIQYENRIIDSLKNVLITRANKIESEKSKSNPDNDLIANLRSGSISISNSISFHQNKEEAYTKQLTSISKTLDVRYSTIIDSLSTLKKNPKNDSKNIDKTILVFTEKRLRISPQIKTLSFNPDKILNINVEKITNDQEKKFYIDYLSSALNEVNNLLPKVNSQLNDVNYTLKIQKKTSKFLSESEFDLNPNLRNPSTTTSTYNSRESSTAIDFNNSIKEQSGSYILLLDQLNIFDKTGKTSYPEFELKTGKQNLSLKEYSNLLKEVIKRLNDYKLVLASKLEHLK